MNIYVYSDESGVFDKAHNDVYVFGALIFLSDESRQECSRKYKHTEDMVRASGSYEATSEIKGCKITGKQKGSLFRSLNQYYKFGAVVNQRLIVNETFANKKTKQRYLDYVYKISLKRAFEHLIRQEIILPTQVEHINIFADEHTTATNGRYELREGLEQEFKIGTLNYKYNTFYEPIFTNLKTVDLSFCNSASKILIRAADIVANHIYYEAVHNENFQVIKREKMRITYFP